MSFLAGRGRWQMACAADVGRQRNHQEDVAVTVDTLDLLVVADGMGGQSSGIVASSTAVESIERALHLWAREPWGQDREVESHPLLLAVALANAHVFERHHTGKHPGGQCTTIVAAQRAGDRVVIAHVGDSRAYRLRAGRIELLTRDHTMLNEPSVQEQLRQHSDLTPEAMERLGDILMRVVGHRATVEIDARVEPLQAGDVYLLTSDGVPDELTDEEMTALLVETRTLPEGCRRLIAAANERGGRDNLAVALARWEGA